MLTMNRATVLGYAGRHPEMRRLPSGDEVALFSLATNERFRRRDGTDGEATDWHAVVAFGTAAETVRKRVRKGDPVLVEGRMVTRSWTDRTGTEHRTTEIVVSGPQARVNVLVRRRPAPGDDSPSGGAVAGAAKPAVPERADAVAADTGDGTSEVAESGAAGDANAASGKVANPAQETESAGTGTAGLDNASDAKAEEVLAGTGVDEAATAAGTSSETGDTADAARLDEVGRGLGETASSAEASSSPATSDGNAAEPVEADTAAAAGAASTGPPSEIEAASGDSSPSADASASAASAAAPHDAAAVAGIGDDSNGAPACETRGTAAEDTSSAGAGSQPASEGAAAGTGLAASPIDTAGATEGVPGAGSVPPAQLELDVGETDGDSRDGAADEDDSDA